MTLATHAVVGAAFAQLFPTHPVAAFAVGFASHFAIDSLPHWDYEILSIKQDEKHPLETDMPLGKYFVEDCLRIASDALIGIALSMAIFYYLFHGAPLRITLIGAMAGILPDPLQFVYWKGRSIFLLPLQKFHIWIQKDRSLYIKPWIGLSLQLALVMIICTAVLLVQAGK